MMKKLSLFVLILLAFSHCMQETRFEVPPITRECKPWAYWWWMGSAVDRQNLSHQLNDFADAGFGGVHIIPIYGVKGKENQYIDYLCPEWMEMLAYTVKTAGKLGLGVDMSTGTGWPFGGPQVEPFHAAKLFQLQAYRLSTGKSVDEPIELANKRYREHATLKKLVAINEKKVQVELTEMIDSTGVLQWQAPKGEWTIIAMFESLTGQNVKRAAPGANGLVMDYFSQEALNDYLARFDSAFSHYHGKSIRAMYNDSYEVYNANWTTDFAAEFKRRRGYDLTDYLAAFAGKAAQDTVARIKCDYRETIADLLLDEFTIPWVKWSHDHGWITRNEAHGSPANLLDLYAAADVPETEIFGPTGFPIPGLRTDPDFPAGERSAPDVLMMKFASSAAHLSEKKWVSSESCTWLGEHFRVALSQVKPEIDQLFLGGINHVLYHGVAYSPYEEPWPGWLFYASTNFGPSNAFWHDIPALNAYIARCQSYLQTGESANDILLYWPVYDLWQNADGWLTQFTVHNLDEWLKNSAFYATASLLWQHGFTFDYISDRQLHAATADTESVHLLQQKYKTILIPGCQYMPIATLKQLQHLAEQGAAILFQNDLPRDVPGLFQLNDRQIELQRIRQHVSDVEQDDFSIQEIQLGKGRWLISDFVEPMLEKSLHLQREPMVDTGVRFIRRRHENGWLYFVTNLSARPVSEWVSLGKPAASVMLIDPQLDRNGLAALRNRTATRCELLLQLQPGESRILWTHDTDVLKALPWQYSKPAGEPVLLKGAWQVEFIAGGPQLPESYQTQRLESWTTCGDSAALRFAGTARYTLTFEKPAISPDDWLLDVGDVRETARIRLNGRNLGTLWSIPYAMSVGRWLRTGSNTLEIEVTNLSANRIRDLDRRGVEWRKFHDINFVNINYKPFDASDWPVQPSGLLGPVRLVPLKTIEN